MNSKLTRALLLATTLVVAARAELSVFVAASTTDALKEAAAAYEQGGGKAVRFNFAGSGTLARQIEAGAPCDIFLSANVQWMDWLEGGGLLAEGSRLNLLTNSLVMVVPADSSLPFNGEIGGRIAVGDFRSVPAGMYAEEALQHMGWFDRLKPKLVMASNVRTALMYVERGEAAAGIVYATDAEASGSVRVAGTFPAESHRPIAYPVARCSNHADAAAILAFLQTTEAKRIFEAHGFR